MSDYRTTTGEAAPLSRHERGRKRRQIAWASFALLAMLIGGGAGIRVNRYVRATGWITAEPYAEVRPSVQGAVARILARSGETVDAGAILVQLDDTEQQAACNEMSNHVRQAEAQLSRRESEIEQEKKQRKSAIAILELRLAHAESRLKVVEELCEKGLASGSALGDQKLNLELARAELASLMDVDASLPEKELAVLRSQVDAARQAMARVAAQVEARKVRTPISGSVLRYGFVVGELVRPDTVLYEIFGDEEQRIELRVPERYAALVVPGQTYEAKLGPYRKSWRSVRFTGTIDRRRDVIQGEDKQTYRVVYGRFDARDLPVPPGTTAEARIRVNRSSLWSCLFGFY